MFARSDFETLADILAALKGRFLLSLNDTPEVRENELIQGPAEMVESLLRPLDPTQSVSEIVEKVAQTVDAEICSLWLVDHSESELRLADGYGFNMDERGQTYALVDAQEGDEKCIDGITAWVAIRQRDFWANSWGELMRHPSWRGKWDTQQWKDKEFRCLYAVPLIRQGSTVGVLKVENSRRAAFFSNSDRAVCRIMASLIVLALNHGQHVRMRLISDIAHLMRSPIGQLPVNLHAIERELAKWEKNGKLRTDRIRQKIETIRRAASTVRVTSRTLTAHAQLATTISRPETTEVRRLKEVIETLVRDARGLAYDGVTIDFDVHPDVIQVELEMGVPDWTRFEIAVDNILHNAIKFSNPHNKVEVLLSAGPKPMPGIVRLTVRDKGVGISGEDLPLVCNPGFTRRAPKHPQSTGMGLATVKEIVDRLNWELKIESEVNHGTTVRISMPVQGARAVQ